MSLMLRQTGALDVQPRKGSTIGSQGREPLPPALEGTSRPIDPPSFQYDLEPRRHGRKLAVSFVLHLAALFLLIRVAPWLRMGILDSLDPAHNRKVALVAPTVSPDRPIEVKAVTPVMEHQETIETPKIAHIQRPPDVPAAPVQPVIAPKFKNPILTAEKPNVLLEKKVVVNTFDAGSSMKPVVNKPAAQVQTGGFGDQQGVNGVGQRNAPVMIARVGSFDAPAGEGKGNGTGGSRGTSGVVTSSGFGDGTAGKGTATQRKGSVASTSFGTVTPTDTTQKVRTQVAANTTPVQVQYKPRPVYTEEARSHHVEGEVVLEVMFGASGELKVLRVVQGLGYGLDQSAVAAASQIRFRPAMQNGQPAASTALVHIVFELAQ